MSRRILAVLAALLLALFGTGAMFAYVSNADERALEGQEAVKVLMAAKEIPAGTTAQAAEKKGLVRADMLPKKAVPSGALTEVGSEVGALVATASIASGEVLTRSRFGTAVTNTAGLAVPEGKVAVSVEMADPGRVGGFVEPGSEIAVFDTFNVLDAEPGNRPSGDHIADRHEYLRDTTVLLSRVGVLAVAGSTSSKNEEEDADAAPTETTIVTVAVTPDEAAKLVHAVNTGTLYFALLNGTSKVEAGKSVDDTNLFD
ncbi:MAG: Flp pilus assembly protein CpaB [Actinomycetes bacterium]